MESLECVEKKKKEFGSPIKVLPRDMNRILKALINKIETTLDVFRKEYQQPTGNEVSKEVKYKRSIQRMATYGERVQNIRLAMGMKWEFTQRCQEGMMIEQAKIMKIIFNAFSACGKILDCKAVQNVEGGNKGYGFVQYETREAAVNAKQKIVKQKQRIQGDFH